MALTTLGGCSIGGDGRRSSSAANQTPSFAEEPFTHQQQLVTEGARLVISDGCSACHLLDAHRALGPSFQSFAGHRITLWNGRRVLVDERFLRQALLHPRENRVRGYPLLPMLSALKRVRLDRHPDQLAALVAFIEQIGPE